MTAEIATDLSESDGKDGRAFDGRPMRIHVHLAYGFGRENWARRYDDGRLVGTNERDPYGYRRCESMGASLTSSLDNDENRLSKLLRLGVRAMLGFDLIHAWRNRAAILGSEIVWTHTESQFLAVALLYKMLRLRKSHRPLLLSQSVWLIDRWHKQLALRRWFWAALVRESDVLTFHSPANRKMAAQLFAGCRTELVRFGIRAEGKLPVKIQAKTGGLNIISVGNDTHRDWATAIEAMALLPNDTLTIVSSTCDPALLKNADNVSRISAQANDQLRALYEQADIALVPLKANLHASGCTALQEAALHGLPIVATAAGGIETYFDEPAVRLARLSDARHIADIVNELRQNPRLRQDIAEAGQARMGPAGLSSEAFIRRHVEISRSLLASQK